MSANANFKNNHLSTKWYIIKNIRKVITGALEKKRADKIIGSSLEANIKVYLSDKLKKDISNVHLDEIAITSSFEVLSYDSQKSGFEMDDIQGVKVEVEKVKGDKCQRCWKYKEMLHLNNICDRCKEAI